MKAEKLSFEKVGRFAPVFLDYLAQKESLRPFYNQPPTIDGFGKLLKDRHLDTDKRHTLVQVLKEQYAHLEVGEQVSGNIESLKHEKTFTITTGHQLNLFTGPLYFIFKIATVINTCKALKEAYPDYHFVPVYWMATEDHDFEEINHFHLFRRKITWESDQRGPVGRFRTDSIQSLLATIPEPTDIFDKAYTENATLADACRHYVNALFEDEGLVVVDGDNNALKAGFAPTMEADILSQRANGLVSETNQKLVEAGYKSQAFSREINFFYIGDTFRERIERQGDLFTVKNTEISWTETELRKLLHQHPESFSPNVIMRPLYQETILPNLGYVGGPAEMAYWLQLGGVFEHYKTSFPVLLPRNFGLVIDHVIARKIEKLGLDNEGLFEDAHGLKERILLQVGENHLLDEEKVALQKVLDAIKTKAAQVDVTLEEYVGAQGAGIFKVLDNVQRKIKRANERNNDIAMNQIDDVMEGLFPDGGLQERHDNFLNFYIHHETFIQDLLAHFDPFDLKFYLLWIK